MTKEKTDKEIEEKLFSTQPGVAISAINSIKERGNKLYIPLLLDLLNSNPEKEIADEINKLLSTIKDAETRDGFIDAITNKRYKSIRKIILTACWQNGLDFSDYIQVFVDVIISDNWENSFEAFTIIDNLKSLPEQKIVDKVVIKIEAAMENANEQKAYFLNEILNKLN